MTTKPNIVLELILAAVLLLLGLLVLPAVIFVVGTKLFGVYDASGGMSVFYSNFMKDLSTASLAAWAIALGPFILVTLVRVIVGGFPFVSQISEPPAKSARVEPSIRS